MKKPKSSKTEKIDKLDLFSSLWKQRPFRVIIAIGLLYLLMVTVEIPLVFKSWSSTSNSASIDSLSRPEKLETEQQEPQFKTIPNPPSSKPDSKPTLNRTVREHHRGLLSSLRFDSETFDPSSKDGSVELHKSAKEAWQLGRKLWKELESGRLEKAVEKPEKNKSDTCPHSVSLTGSEFMNRENQLMELPCGLTLGSHVTLVGRPRKGYPKEGDGSKLVSQFVIELQGLKTVDGEDPPRILHFNPRLKGDWSKKPVIEQNTCYRMQWGSSQRCEGWRSRDEEETVDSHVKCEKWIRDDDNYSEGSRARWWLNRLIGRRKRVKVEWPFPFVEEKLFVLTLSAGLEGYHINVDGQHVTSFPYRTGFTLEDATGLTVNGDIDVHSVVVASLPTSHPSFAPQRHLELSKRWQAPLVPDGPVELFIGILSAGNHFGERMAVRKSWMQHVLITSSKVVARFFVALHGRKEVNVELKKEAEYFGPIRISHYTMLTTRPTFVFFLLFLSLPLSSFSQPSNPVYNSFLKCFSDKTKTPQAQNVFSQTNPSYSSVLRAYIRNARFNTSSTPKPTLIITPRSYSHVSAAVLCSKPLNFVFKIRSGGHDYDGLSYVSDKPFFVLDLSNLRDVTVNIADQTAWISAGATLGEVYYRIWEKSKVHGFPAGVCPTVGVGGHLSGGGYGNMLRKFGLSVDNLIDAKIVDVNGRILDRKSMGEDLFWAISGGGGVSFGVVLGYKVKLVPVPRVVTVFRVEQFMESGAVDMVHKWQSVGPRTNRNLFLRMLLQPVTRNKVQTVRATAVALFLGRADDVVSLLRKELPELALKKENCTEMTWFQSALWWDNRLNATQIDPKVFLDRNLDSSRFLKRKSDYVATEIPRDGIESLFKKMIELGKVGLVFNPYGGKMAEIAEDATPLPHRKMLFKIQYSVNWQESSPEIEKGFLNQSRVLHSFMTQFVSKNPRRAYLNYRDVDIGVNDHGPNSYEEGEVYGRMYFGKNFDRLVKIKTAVDPGNFFRNEQSIPTLPSKA